MPVSKLLSHIIGIDSKKFSKKENIILQAELYLCVHYELWEFFQSQYHDYFKLLNFNIEMEKMMMEANFICYLINDILNSEAYTLSGIAYYTQLPEEVIQDLFINNRESPIITFIRRLIELHKTIKPEIYRNVIKKITSDND